MPFAHSFYIETPTQLVDIMLDQGIYLPMNMNLSEIGNVRLIVLTHRLHLIPFHIKKINEFWFVEKIIHNDLKNYLKEGDRILIINKRMIDDNLEETDIFKLILHSPLPIIIWATWNPEIYLKHQIETEDREYEHDYIATKLYLLKTLYNDDISLYDYLAFIIGKAIQNSEHTLDNLLESLKPQIHYSILKSNLRSTNDNSDLSLVKIQAQLLQSKDRYFLKPDDFTIQSLPSLINIGYYCSNSGYGIHMTEMILVWAAMKRLNDHIHCKEMKFWGKIFGLYADYYIVQVQHDSEIVFDKIDLFVRQEHVKKQNFTHRTYYEDKDMNQCTYFVTTAPGLPWFKLPNVTLNMIEWAKSIRYLFTGCLSSTIHSSSTCHNSEKDYLRAQIARITATTHISPAGFYILSEIEHEGEEGIEEENYSILKQNHTNIIMNPEYNNDPTNMITTEILANPNLQEWVHSLSEIVPCQHSTSMTTIHSKNDDDNELINDNHFPRPSPFLQPIGDDKPMHTDQSPWSIGLTMSILREYSLCYVRSNIWPGAFTLGDDRNYLNFYVGWGQKYEQFNPSGVFSPSNEYAQELIEQNDPAVETENAFYNVRRLANFQNSDEELSDEEENIDEEP